jgi:aryl-alcohol dehydrogenase-like predicted oxidoreductase
VIIDGMATPEGTKIYSSAFKNFPWNSLEKLMVTPLGFGGYRIDVSVQSHHEALGKALSSGINLVDTSANYADGGSEALIGSVLSSLIHAQKIKRDQVVIVSKAGYLQGQNYALSQNKKKEGHPFPELVLYEEGLEHCIHPDFLQDQLTRSLERLQLKTVDVYLLHNPEYYLDIAAQKEVPVPEAQEEYCRRIAMAFQHLELEVKKGRIQYYGISSNTFPKESMDPKFTSLERVWDIAESISKNHHFRVVQFPMNLLETGASVEKNQSGQQSVLDFAVEKKIYVLINRPLNAIYQDHLVRLADKDSEENISYNTQMQALLQHIKTQAAESDLDWSAAPSLSQMALRALRSTSGIGSVLVGMRQKKYVQDVLKELQRPVPVLKRNASWLTLTQHLSLENN